MLADFQPMQPVRRRQIVSESPNETNEVENAMQLYAASGMNNRIVAGASKWAANQLVGVLCFMALDCLLKGCWELVVVSNGSSWKAWGGSIEMLLLAAGAAV